MWSAVSATPPRLDRRALLEGVAVAVVVTGVVAVLAKVAPERFVAIAVAGAFLVATWVMVWRHDDAFVERMGLALGGLVLPGAVDQKRLLRSAAVALGWAAAAAAITFVPFYFGWRFFWHPRGTFAFHRPPFEVLNEIAGQVVIIALPEEAFYRGYLQSRIDDALPWKVRILGADVGLSLLVTSAIFALGHFATIHEPTRLAVFFPSLLFGWLRARTGGIGAGLAFHATCNVFSEILGKGYRVY